MEAGKVGADATARIPPPPHNCRDAFACRRRLPTYGRNDYRFRAASLPFFSMAE